MLAISPHSDQSDPNISKTEAQFQAATTVINRHPIISHESSERYARALIDREVAVLMLGEAKLVADIDLAGREVRPPSGLLSLYCLSSAPLPPLPLILTLILTFDS